MQAQPTEAQIDVAKRLETAIRMRNPELVESAVSATFPTPHPIQSPALILLAEASWHQRHASYRISTTDNYSSRKTARVKTYGDVIIDHAFHAEPKCADANGVASTKQTVGLLQRRHIRIASITPIGKESNTLEELTSGLAHSIDDVYTVYLEPKRDEWIRIIVPALKRVALSTLVRESGLSRRTIINARTGKRRPHPKNQRILLEFLRRSGLVK